MLPRIAGAYTFRYDHRTRRLLRISPTAADLITYSGGLSVQEPRRPAGAETERASARPRRGEGAVGRRPNQYDANAIHPGGSPDSSAAASSPVVEYIRGSDYGGGIGGILYSIRAGQASCQHYNSRGDVIAKSGADATATVTWAAAYLAFGTRPEECGTNPDPHRANTKEEDRTGLLNEGHRYRCLETGMFISRDPAGFVDGPNLYAYVMQNPWTSFDPEGLAKAKVSINQLKEAAAYHHEAGAAAGREGNRIGGMIKTAREQGDSATVESLKQEQKKQFELRSEHYSNRRTLLAIIRARLHFEQHYGEDGYGTPLRPSRVQFYNEMLGEESGDLQHAMWEPASGYLMPREMTKGMVRFVENGLALSTIWMPGVGGANGIFRVASAARSANSVREAAHLAGMGRAVWSGGWEMKGVAEGLGLKTLAVSKYADKLYSAGKSAQVKVESMRWVRTATDGLTAVVRHGVKQFGPVFNLEVKYARSLNKLSTWIHSVR